MERIILEVDDAVAKSWRNTTPQIKSLIERHISGELTDLLLKSQRANFDLLLKQAGDEAAANGLTEDILQKLLEEDE